MVLNLQSSLPRRAEGKAQSNEECAFNKWAFDGSCWVTISQELRCRHMFQKIRAVNRV